MGILSWIIFGLIAGIIAKLLTPGEDPGGCIMTSLLGIGGAVVGGWLGTLFGWGEVNSFSLGSFGIAIVGAVVILLIYRAIAGKK